VVEEKREKRKRAGRGREGDGAEGGKIQISLRRQGGQALLIGKKKTLGDQGPQGTGGDGRKGARPSRKEGVKDQKRCLEGGVKRMDGE